MSDDFPAEAMWVADNLASFSPHFVALFAAVALALFLTRSPRTGALALVAALPFAAMVAIAAIGGSTVEACSAGLARLKVASVNLLDYNQHTDAVLDFIHAAAPDVVAFQEAGDGWHGRLDPLFADYPHRAASPGGATQLFSRRPFLSPPVRRVVPSLRRSVSAEIDVGGTAVTVIAAHFLKPGNARARLHRRAEMDEIAAVVEGAGRPTILMGDFNAAPTSLDFRALIDESPLRPPALQLPPVTTWPSRLPGLGIQIDHVLISGPLRFERVAAGPDVGSNHLPVLADLALDPRDVCVAPGAAAIP